MQLEYDTLYTIYVISRNVVGSSEPASIQVQIELFPDPQTSIVTKPDEAVAGEEFEVLVQLLSFDGLNIINGPPVILEVSDVCEIGESYLCERVESTHADYVTDLLDKRQYV